MQWEIQELLEGVYRKAEIKGGQEQEKLKGQEEFQAKNYLRN